MMIFRKEKAARSLILEHIAATHDCVAEARAVLEDYLAGERSSMQQRALNVKTFEHRGDALKHQIRAVLHEGAFLPRVRSDVHGLVEGIEAIAGAAERTAQFVVWQSPAVPEAFETDLMEVFSQCVACFHELRKALTEFFETKGDVASLHRHAGRVSELESAIDALQAALTRKIFNSERELAEKMHLNQLLQYIAAISDLAENVADDLESTVMRSVV